MWQSSLTRNSRSQLLKALLFTMGAALGTAACAADQSTMEPPLLRATLEDQVYLVDELQRRADVMEDRLIEFDMEMAAVDSELGGIYDDFDRDHMAAAKFEKATRTELQKLSTRVATLERLLSAKNQQVDQPRTTPAGITHTDLSKAFHDGEYDTVVIHAPGVLVLPQTGTADIRFFYAESLFQTGRPAEAHDQFLYLLEFNPVSPRTPFLQERLSQTAAAAGQPGDTHRYFGRGSGVAGAGT